MKLSGLTFLLYFLAIAETINAFSCPSRYTHQVRLSSQAGSNVCPQIQRNVNERIRGRSVLFQTFDVSEADPQVPRNETLGPVPIAAAKQPIRMSRARQALPKNDGLDRKIVGTALPNMVNMLVVPLVNSVDTFWVGRMGSALALAGQAAANNAFMTIFYFLNFLPIITAPLGTKLFRSTTCKIHPTLTLFHGVYISSGRRSCFRG